VVRYKIPFEKAEACTGGPWLFNWHQERVEDRHRLMQRLHSSHYLATTTNSQEDSPGVDSPRYFDPPPCT